MEPVSTATDPSQHPPDTDTAGIEQPPERCGLAVPRPSGSSLRQRLPRSAILPRNGLSGATALFKELPMLKTLPVGTLAWPRRAAIIGAGTMGLGVAECWIAAGVAVTLIDAAPEQTRLAWARLAERVHK